MEPHVATQKLKALPGGPMPVIQPDAVEGVLNGVYLPGACNLILTGADPLLPQTELTTFNILLIVWPIYLTISF